MKKVIQIQKDVRVDLNMRVADDNFFCGGPCGEPPMVAVCVDEGICQCYYEEIIDGGRKVIYNNGTYAFREHKTGIQFFDGCSWRLFCDVAQQQWSDYIADKVILEED